MNVLTVDVGGNNIKVLTSGESKRRKVPSGPDLTASQMVESVLELVEGWKYEAVSIGFPGPVARNAPLAEPVNLGTGWCGFDYAQALGRPVKMVNDALMQAIGSYEGGRMLFLGLGTGLGSAMVMEHVAQPMEIQHLPYKKGKSFEDYVGTAGLDSLGRDEWRRAVIDVVERLRAALLPDYIVLGGGNVTKLKSLPENTRRGANANAFKGGFRLWEENGLKIP
jgi:polyphosphate glucokinase